MELSPAFAQLHFTPQQLSAMWGFSEKMIRNMFMDEPGVLRIEGRGGRVRGPKVLLRIPATVAQRVYEERTARSIFREEIKRVRR